MFFGKLQQILIDTFGKLNYLAVRRLQIVAQDCLQLRKSAPALVITISGIFVGI